MSAVTLRKSNFGHEVGYQVFADGVLVGYVRLAHIKRLSGRPSVTGSYVFEDRWFNDADDIAYRTRTQAVEALVAARPS